MREPAYNRLDVDTRRRRLLERGADLFARHSYDQLSMAGIARAAGVSKALLYHYFPSKQAYFGAVLAEGAAELVGVVDADAPPAEQLDAFLGWIDQRGDAYANLVRGAAPEVRDLMEAIRGATAQRILDALSRRAHPAAPHRGGGVAVVHGRRDPRLGRAPRPRAGRAAGVAAPGARGSTRRAAQPCLTFRRSTMKRSASLGPMLGGEPCSP